MATKRITLTIDEKTHGLLTELSDVANVSISSFVQEVLGHAEPQIVAIIAAVRAAKDNPAAAMRMLGQAVGDAQNAIQGVQDVIQKDTKPRKVRKAG
jgi:uncharacterized protein (DUF1778 family)